MKDKLKPIALVLLALLALASCRDLSLDPVFYTLSQEQPLSEDRGFPDQAPAIKMVRMTAGADDYYVVAANSLYAREVSAGTWQKVSPPPGLGNASCNTLEYFGTYLYAGFIDINSADGLGLWRTNDLVSWEEITDGDATFGSADDQIFKLKAAGGVLFAAVATWTYATDPDAGHWEYSLFYSNSGSDESFAAANAAPDPQLPLIDVASDGGLNFWLIAGNGVYRSTAGAGGAFSLLATPSLGDAARYYGGLLYDGGTLYLSATDGYIHSSTDLGASWASSQEFLDGGDSDKPIPFGPMVYVNDLGENALYVGTGYYVGGYGYYRVPAGDVTEGSGDITREPSYNIVDLYEGAVNFLLYDPVEDNLLLCMSRAGVWRGYGWNGSAWTWRQE